MKLHYTTTCLIRIPSNSIKMVNSVAKNNNQFCLVVKDLALRENEMFVEESCHLISCSMN